MVSENSFKKFLYLDALNSDLELVLFLLVGYKKTHLIVITSPLLVLKQT